MATASKFSMSLDDNYGSSFFSTNGLSTTPTSSLTAMLAAAAAAVPTSSLNSTSTTTQSYLNNIEYDDLNLNLQNLTDDDDEVSESKLRQKQQHQQQQNKQQQFHFNESLELDDEIIFNNNPSAKSSPSPKPKQEPQQATIQFNTEMMKCANKNCFYSRNGYNYKPSQQQQDNNSSLFIQLHCTSTKCKDLRICFHNLCYETILNEINLNYNNSHKKQRGRSYSLEYTNIGKQQHQITELACSNCNGYLKMFKPAAMPSPPPSSSSSSSASVSPPLQHPTAKQQQQQLAAHMQQHQQKQHFTNNNNNNNSHYTSPPINIQSRSQQNMLRKRSIGGLNNPPLPIPMQPLHESDAISTSPSSQQQQQQQQQQMCNTQQAPSKHYNMKNQYKFKQSAPVNVPNNMQQQQQQQQNNRYRTLSCGSTGSFSASSSFSSSIGTSPVVTNQSANLWKKMVNNNQNSYISSSGNYSGTSCSNSSVSSICTYRASTSSNAGDQAIGPAKSEINFEDKLIASSGNIFYKRDDWSILSLIPSNKQNTFHIRLEDEGPYGNDEVRCYVLSHFSSLCIRDLKCVLCSDDMKIYDRFPLTDGTLFMSPFIYDKSKAVTAGMSNKELYVYGVCLKCMNGSHNIRCKSCNQEWKSESLQIGTLYKYDIFAAFPCCPKRFNCNKCSKQVVDIVENNSFNANNAVGGIVVSNGGLPYFSSYSEEHECQHCKFRAYHFIKPIDVLFNKI